MSAKSKLFNNVYKQASYEFDCDNSTVKQVRPVVFADAEEFLQEEINKRNSLGNVLVKVMADGRQGFFKISITIFPENYSPKSHSESDAEEPNETPRKHTRYSDGGKINKEFKLSSIYKLI